MSEVSLKKKFTGTVVSDKMDKTRVIIVESVKKHPIYGKFLSRRKKFMVNDAENKAKIGDKVVVQETRPISKKKRWDIIEIVESAK